jgi:uncharacterized membrane protein YcaP (DUF421 family)
VAFVNQNVSFSGPKSVWYYNTTNGTETSLFCSLAMESLFQAIFGVKDHLSTLQECARAVLMFFYGLALLRLSGYRTFAHWSALDIIVSIMAGSALARALTGSAPLLGTMAAVAVLVVLHLVFAYAVAASKPLARIIEGEPIDLIKAGMLDEKQRIRRALSKIDIEEALRDKQLEGLDDLAKVKSMRLEPSGKLSVIKQKS